MKGNKPSKTRTNITDAPFSLFALASSSCAQLDCRGVKLLAYPHRGAHKETCSKNLAVATPFPYGRTQLRQLPEPLVAGIMVVFDILRSVHLVILTVCLGAFLSACPSFKVSSPDDHSRIMQPQPTIVSIDVEPSMSNLVVKVDGVDFSNQMNPTADNLSQGEFSLPAGQHTITIDVDGHCWVLLGLHGPLYCQSHCLRWTVECADPIYQDCAPRR